ncbi:hypothetical protein [Bdellovibrio svalbardensis]|uniref:Lipoprotein n=1 Tax=Bdellovibrio svalbardensis TaxID=2972972 RepID=A0ABT6DIQ5_9BACT|nr:hypothetical protein [Bdellovibrio svalbardensis]MDG0816717.1 hypothetical protein [Bdellovibrio svalbardensis]
MKAFILLGLLASFLTACAAGEESVSVSSSVSTAQLIPSPATSCLAIKQATSGTTPSADISAAYFRIPRITFTKKNVDKDLYISLITITMNIPGSSAPFECKVGGDALAALSNDANWWGTGTIHDSKVPAGTETFTTNCPLYCGGISSVTPFFTTATMEILGYEQAAGSDEQEPVKTTTIFNVQNAF